MWFCKRKDPSSLLRHTRANYFDRWPDVPCGNKSEHFNSLLENTDCMACVVKEHAAIERDQRVRERNELAEAVVNEIERRKLNPPPPQ